MIRDRESQSEVRSETGNRGEVMNRIKKNELYTVEIGGLNHDGQGVGRIDGMTVFVDGALAGETCEVKILLSKKSYAIAEIVKIVKKSENRIEPFCEYYGKCGGCSLQHMDYGAQLLQKANVVEESIKRIGKIENVKIHKTIGMAKPFNYRNKAQFPVGIEAGKPVCGFFTKKTHDICNILNCGIQNEVSIAVNEAVKEFISKFKNIRVYEELRGTGLIRHVMTRVGFKTGEVMAVIVINGNDMPHKNEMIALIKEKVETLKPVNFVLKSVFLNVNTKNTNIILGDKNINIFGEAHITDYIGKYRFDISPLSFFQVNPVQTEVMYNKILEFAAPKGKETVLDIYSGAGTISLFVSSKVGKIYGVEVVKDAVEDAERNAAKNGADNVEFICGEAEEVIPQLSLQRIIPDIVVVDPPRKGCDESVLRAIADMKPQKIIYVSCNPATLARDLRYLEDNGFKTVEVQPVDMFPWTPHVETVVLMSKVNK